MGRSNIPLSRIPVPERDITCRKDRTGTLDALRYVDYCSMLIPKSGLTDEPFQEIRVSIEKEERKWKPEKDKKRDKIPFGRVHSRRRLDGFSPQVRSAMEEETNSDSSRRGYFGREYGTPTIRKSFTSIRVGTAQREMSTIDLQNAPSSQSVASPLGLMRSATTSRVGGSPRAFGEKTYMSKDDHDRERNRWLTKLDDIEMRLVESETLNSDMHQIKAELNKKIVELEKGQKPLIEQNRKLSDRNKMLQSEAKKIEQKLSHSLDDYLTLRDVHERLVKENTTLKEKRAYPEKLEELDRYRNQVLEYSKCITALRSAGLEKDRRYELLVQKFKRLRKCFLKKGDNEDDRASTVGSDCSAESSISLDTITEDFEESLNKDIEINYQALFKENAELQRALNDLKLNSTGLSEENLLRNQLSFAQTTIAQQQILIDGHQEMLSQCGDMRSTITAQQETIRKLETQIAKLQDDVAASKHTNEELEFQVLEMEQNSQAEEAQKDMKEIALDTSEQFEDENVEVMAENCDMSSERISEMKKNIVELKQARNLRLAQRQIVANTEGYIGGLEEKIQVKDSESAQQRTQVEQTISELKKLQIKESETDQQRTVFEQTISELKAQIEESYSKEKKKRELQKEVEELRKKLADMDKIRESLNNQMRQLSMELGSIRSQLKTKDSELETALKVKEELTKQVSEIENEKTSLEVASSAQLDETKKELQEKLQVIEQLQKEREEMDKKHADLVDEYQKFKEEQRPSIRTELERRYEETRYRLQMALDKIQNYEVILETAKKTDSDNTLSDALQADLVQLKDYNQHLERQFQAQNDIIEALKTKVIQQKTFATFLNKMSDIEEVDAIHDELLRYSHSEDKEVARMADTIAYILKAAKKQSLLSTISPLEISTAHHKIRPCASVDSSGEWLSNSSEGVISPGGPHDHWNETKQHKHAQCGHSERSLSSQST